MAAPWTPEWLADWRRLTSAEHDALECMYDGPIPHQAILDTIRMRPVTAVTVDPLISRILTAHGVVPRNGE